MSTRAKQQEFEERTDNQKGENAPREKMKDPKDPSSLQRELPSRKENYPRSRESCSKGLEGMGLKLTWGPE